MLTFEKSFISKSASSMRMEIFMLIISIRLLLFQVEEILLLEEEPPDAKVERVNSCSPKAGQICNIPPPKPQWAWQVTRKHAVLSAHDQVMFGGLTSSVQHLSTPSPKVAPGWLGPFEHRHAFQQKLIEEQRRQLQEQQELILELQGNQSLKKAQEDAEQATAVSRALGNPAPRGGNQTDYKNVRPSRYSANNINIYLSDGCTMPGWDSSLQGTSMVLSALILSSKQPCEVG